ncbi:hypothetical protein ES705_25539 [subsurface metagenome]
MQRSFSIVLFLMLISHSLYGAKIDTVYFQDGNKITGEVKIMENNLLELSTDDAGRIKIEWNNIDSIYIKQRMRIEHKDGRILFGTLSPTRTLKVAVLLLDDGTAISLEHINVIRITPDKLKFFTRLDGKVSTGFSYTKASDLAKLDFAGNVLYRHNLNQIEIDYTILLTEQSGREQTQNQNGGLQYLRLLQKKWFLFNRLSAESNSELGLKLRTNFALGGGNNLVYSNYSVLYFAGGLQANRETTADTATYNLEGVITSKFSAFKYSSPKLSFDLSGTVFPSFNNWGRIRTNVESTLSWEVFEDFYLKWSMYYTYDNRPLSKEGSKNDWAITLLGLEYTF